MYLHDSIPSLKIFCITTSDFGASLFHSTIYMEQACTNRKGVRYTERLRTLLVGVCMMTLQMKSFTLILEEVDLRSGKRICS